jgi:hypothetical protein
LLHSLKLRCLAHRWSFSPLETLRCRPSSFQKLTLFSQKNIVLYPPSSNTDSFLKHTQCSFDSLESSYFAQIWCSSHFKTLRDMQYSCYIVTEFSLLYKVLNSLTCNSNGSFTRDKVLLPFTWKGYLAER